MYFKNQIDAIIECHDVELGKLVRATYVECLGPLDQEVTTMDLLKRIELRMEFLTQHLERLPGEKVKIAQRVTSLIIYCHCAVINTAYVRREYIHSARHTTLAASILGMLSTLLLTERILKKLIYLDL